MNVDKLSKAMKKVYIEPDRRKRYRNKNKAKYLAWKTKKHVCTVCAGTYSNNNKVKHRRTEKHTKGKKNAKKVTRRG